MGLSSHNQAAAIALCILCKVIVRVNRNPNFLSFVKKKKTNIKMYVGS